MSAPWDHMREVLNGSLRTLQANQQFRVAQDEMPILAEFADASALVDYLASDSEELEVQEHKDQIYAALIRAVQSHASWAREANTALFLGLWPLLDAYYLGFRRYFTDATELDQAIPVAFTILVGRLDLERVRRVAATLVRSTLRDVMRERQRTWRQTSASADLDQTALSASRMSGLIPFDDDPTDPADIEDPSAPRGLSPEGELRLLHARLRRRLGSDVELVLGVFVMERSQQELADQLGLSHDVARKRLQRARDELRQYLLRKVPLSRP